jgi:hypothetical protein
MIDVAGFTASVANAGVVSFKVVAGTVSIVVVYTVAMWSVTESYLQLEQQHAP